MQGGKLSLRIQCYIALHVAAFVPLVLWAVQLSPPRRADLFAALLLAALIAGTWRFELTILTGRQSLVFAIVCLALELQGIAAAAAVAAAGALMTHLLRPSGAGWGLRFVGQPLYRRVFNVAHCAVVAAASGFVWRALQPWLPESGWGLAAGLLVFASVYFLLNTWGIATAIAFEQDLSPAAVWQEHFFWIAPEYLVSAAAAVLIALVYRNVGTVALLLLPCLWLVYRAQRAYVEALRRQRELLEREEQVNRRKDEFLAMLAHELRNPLAAMRNAVTLMRSDPRREDPRRVEILERQLGNLTRLVDDLLDASRVTRGSIQLRPELLDLRAVARHAVETSQYLLEARSHRLSLSLPPQPVPVSGDATRLEQVVTNLLVNAAKYTDPGGHIRLSLELEEAATPLSHTPIAVLRVVDNGIGIPPERLAEAFEPFAQLGRPVEYSQGGLGIGLTLVKRLVEMHGGSIEARGVSPGRGSEFEVRLPAAQRAPAAAPPLAVTEPEVAVGAAPESRPAAARRVLVVDDNVDAAETLAEFLEMWGWEVRVATDGFAAVAAARDYLPEVVLCDISMPGMDGYEVARRLREIEASRSTAGRCSPAGTNGHRMLLVALTGYGQEEYRTRIQEAGFDHHVVKPVDPDALQRLLDGAGDRCAPA